MKQHERTATHNANVKRNAAFVHCGACGSVHLAGCCPTTASNPMQPISSSKSHVIVSSDSDIEAAKLPPRRTAKVQRKKSVHSNSSSSYDDDKESSSSSSDTDHPQPSKVRKHSTTSKLEKTSKLVKVSFEAKTLEEVKCWLIAEFHALHAGIVLPTGRNSRRAYVAVFCRKCTASASASLSSGTTWKSAIRSKVTKCSFVQPSALVSTTAFPASPPVILNTCCFCFDDEVQDAITCPAGLHHWCSVCFSNHVNTLCERKAFGDNNCAVHCEKCQETHVSSYFDMQVLVSRWVYTFSSPAFEVFMQSFRLSKAHYDRYVTAVADKRVLDALQVADRSKPDMDDKVQMALHVLFKPDACPNPTCKLPYEHSGECAAMTCEKCHTKFCLYCHKIVVAVGPQGRHNGDVLSGIAHNHVLDCPKRPPKDDILSSTPLYPTGCGASNGNFLHAFFMARKLEALKMQIQYWPAEDCKRLVLNKQFQELLAELKQKQIHFRTLYPEKPRLLRFAFHRLIGLPDHMDFDVLMQNACWLGDHDAPDVSGAKHGTVERQTAIAIEARPVAAAPLPLPVAAARPARFPYQQQLATLVLMGFDTRAAAQALEATDGNVDIAVGLFLAPE